MIQLTPEQRRVAVAAGRVIVIDMRVTAASVDNAAVTASDALLTFAAALERELDQVDEDLS